MPFQLLAILFRDVSAWYVLVCLAIGVGYAWLLYLPEKKKGGQNYLMSGLRIVTVFLLSFLLLSPLIKTTKTRIEKPIIVVARDASASVPLSSGKEFNWKEFNLGMSRIIASLEEDFEIVQLQFGDRVRKGDTITFTDPYTDVSQLAEYVSQQYPGKNIGALILPTDGIINHRSRDALLTGSLQTSVYAIAMGDTIPKKDLIVGNVNHNQLVYLNDQHEIEVSLAAYASEGAKAALTVSTSDGQLQQHSFLIDSKNWHQKIKLRLDTRKKGWQKVLISLKHLDDEISYENNQRTIYVEVIDGKQQVLILADAPHPDISAIKQALEKQSNYSVDVSYADVAPNDFNAYGLVILHNLPSGRNLNWKSLFQKFGQKPIWLILGNQINPGRLSEVLPSIPIQANRDIQDALPEVDPDFSNFSLSGKTKDFLQKFGTPLNTSVSSRDNYGNVLLTEKQSKQPLMVFYNEKGLNKAVLYGEGLWRWRIENYRHAQGHLQFDELMSKTAQYLTTKADRRKFRADVVKSRFSDAEPVLFNAELYNDLYEPLSGQDISLTVSNGKQNLSYVFSPKDNVYEVNAGLLPAGEYDFVAKTNYGGKLQQVKGKFVVEKTQAELLHTTADHQFLYHLSELSGGKMLYPATMGKLPELIKENEKITSLAFEDESYQDILHLWWVFALLVLLLALEWFIRKRNGLV